MTAAAYELHYPGIIHFGWGCRGRLPEVVSRVVRGNCRPRAMMVISRSVRKEGLMEAALDASVEVGDVYDQVLPDPSLGCVDAISERIRAAGADLVIGIGGGSVLDAAKAAAVLAPVAGAKVAPYFHGSKQISAPGLPFIAIPSTAGTGTEITPNAVLTDVDALIKKSLRHPCMVPCAALVDPELTCSMPPSLTAASGLDALTQAIESYVSTQRNAVSMALAEVAVQRLMVHLPAAFAAGDDRDARSAVAEGSLLSGMAFSQSGLGAVHGLAHPLGAVLNLAHGTTCAILLPHVLRWNAPVCGEPLLSLGRVVGLASAASFIDAVDVLCQALGIPRSFASYGLTRQNFSHVLAHCRSGSMRTNPRPMTDADVVTLLEGLVVPTGKEKG